ncbi:MAG: carbon monoxide dehydrogenase [Chloroflexota bacterium]
MFPATFEYYAPTTLEEALEVLRQNPEAKILAGGHSLIPALKLRLTTPPALVDLRRIPGLAGIRLEGDHLVIGAMTTYYDIQTSDLVRQHVPVLAEATDLVGDLQVRNWGTVGGSLAHSDPAGDYPAIMLALGAEVRARGPQGERTIPIDQFFVGMFTTALQPGEVLTEVRVPVMPPGTGAAYVKFPHPASRYAVVGICAVVTREDNICRQARVAVTGATLQATRATAAEQALQGQPLNPDTIRAAAERAPEGLTIVGDRVFASEEYRTHLVRVLTRRALTAAVEKIR